MKKLLLTCVTVLSCALSVGYSKIVNAEIIRYNLAGSPGTQTENVANFVAQNATGLDLTRSTGLSGTAGQNSMNSNNWSVGQFYSFGFTVESGYFADLTSLEIGTSASNTGPRFFELYSSVDNFTNSLAQIAHGDGTTNFSFVNSSIDLSSLTGLTGLVEFRLRVDEDLRANVTGTNPSTIANTGTARITNYFSGGDTGGFRINGTISAVPEPTSLALLGVVSLGGLAARRFRKKQNSNTETVAA